VNSTLHNKNVTKIHKHRVALLWCVYYAFIRIRDKHLHVHLQSFPLCSQYSIIKHCAYPLLTNHHSTYYQQAYF